MVAITCLSIDGRNDFSNLLDSYIKNALNLQSSAASQANTKAKSVQEHWSKTETFNATKISVIESLFNVPYIYLSVSYISKNSEVSLTGTNSYLEKNPSKFKRSKLTTKSGETVYMLNTRLSMLVDAWHVFRYLNFRKVK